MSKQWQIRRGTTAENDAFTGAVGELTMDTDKKAVRIHDGVTQGGCLIDSVVDFQIPTAANNYTWYRKYASGWVEQGGRNSGMQAIGTNTLPVRMADTSYSVFISRQVTTTADDPAAISIQARNLTTTDFKGYQTYAVQGGGGGQGSGIGYAYVWMVKGMAA